MQRYLSDTDWEEWQKGENSYSEIDNADYKQAADSARRLKAKGLPVQENAEITGLTAEEIEEL